MILATVMGALFIGGGSPVICYTRAQWLGAGRDARLWPPRSNLACVVDVCRAGDAITRCKTLFVPPAMNRWARPLR